MEEKRISLEDALLAIEVFKKALEYRPFITRAILGKEFLALSPEERLQETLTPRIALHYADEGEKIPCLFYRFVGDESPLVEAFYYPIEAIYSFLDEARYYLRRGRTPEQTDEELEKIAFEHAVNMTLSMIDNIPGRGRLMMDSLTEEVIALWHVQNSQRAAHYIASRGESVPRQKDKSLAYAVNEYAKKVLQLWKWRGQTEDNWRKLRLAEEYEVVYKHWNRLTRLLGDVDWREYAKAGKFDDTPDDLLYKLENTERIDKETVEHKVSELAIEHAARRVGLLKKHGVAEAVIKKRKSGVRATGYTSAQLFNYLREGRELNDQLKAKNEHPAQEKTPISFERNEDSAQINKVKSFEQKVHFIKMNSKSSVEQKYDSTQIEKD